MQDEIETVDDPEGWARLQGLIAMLALPEVRLPNGTYARRRVEVRLSSTWQPVDTVVVTKESVVFSHGANGSRREFILARTEPVPAWRMESDGRDDVHPSAPSTTGL